jgi:hypothetical protein
MNMDVLTVDVQLLPSEVRFHERHDFFEAIDPDAGTIEPDAHGRVLLAKPAGSQAELQSPAREHSIVATSFANTAGT